MREGGGRGGRGGGGGGQGVDRIAVVFEQLFSLLKSRERKSLVRIPLAHGIFPGVESYQ